MTMEDEIHSEANGNGYAATNDSKLACVRCSKLAHLQYVCFSAIYLHSSGAAEVYKRSHETKNLLLQMSEMCRAQIATGKCFFLVLFLPTSVLVALAVGSSCVSDCTVGPIFCEVRPCRIAPTPVNVYLFSSGCVLLGNVTQPDSSGIVSAHRTASRLPGAHTKLFTQRPHNRLYQNPTLKIRSPKHSLVVGGIASGRVKDAPANLPSLTTLGGY